LTYGYGPYGSADQGLTQGDTNSTDPINPYRFTNLRTDAGAGFVNARERTYDLDNGRFIQRDSADSPADEADLAADSIGQDRYALASANPISFNEVDGHLTEFNGADSPFAAPSGGGGSGFACGWTDGRLPISSTNEHVSSFQNYRVPFGNSYPDGDCEELGVMVMKGNVKYHGLLRGRMIVTSASEFKYTRAGIVYAGAFDPYIDFKCFRRVSKTKTDECFHAREPGWTGFARVPHKRFGRFYWILDWYWRTPGGLGTEPNGMYRAPKLRSPEYHCSSRRRGPNRCLFEPGAQWRPLELRTGR
jgi:RHS repeat-associated protein